MVRHSTSGRRGLGLALAGTTMTLWGLLPLALKALLEKLDSTTIVGFRFLCSALLVGLLLASRSRLPRLGALRGSGWWLLVIAIVGLGGNYMTYMVGLNLTSPAIAQVIIQLAPPILTFGSLLYFREHFTPLQWLGFSVLLAGLGLFFYAQIEIRADDLGAYYIGVLWVAGAALLWAIYGMAQKQLLVQMSSQSIMLCVYIVCALFFVPLSSTTALFELSSLEWALLAFATLNTVLAYGAFSEALEHLEASRVSAILSLTPLATIAFSRLANGFAPELFPADPIAPWAWVGALAVIAGSVLVALSGSSRRSRKVPKRLAPAAAELRTEGPGSTR